ncbi:MAG: hypothetical protein RLY86_1902 [Pseudomonadota bacterium]|jgi:GAF domain-containing protein
MNFTQSALTRQAPVDIVFRAVCLDICHDLDMDRASVWGFQANDPVLVMAAGFDRRHCRFETGQSIQAAAHPGYFHELYTSDLIEVGDALTDPRLASLRDGYLVPAGVVALLDLVSVDAVDRAIVLCCEQTEHCRRPWRPKDRAYLSAMARLVGLSARFGAQG